MIIKKSSFLVRLLFLDGDPFPTRRQLENLGLTHWQHPSFFAYFPTANTFEATLGDLLASSTSNPGFNVNRDILD
jgi:Pyridoxal-dependent decarboxylase conserved domain